MMKKGQMMAKYYNFNSADHAYDLSYIRYISKYNGLKKPPMDFRYFHTKSPEVYAHIIGSAKYMTGLNFFPEQLYNSIIPMSQLPDGTSLTHNKFKHESNDLSYDSIGLNIKCGYVRSPDKESRWGEFVRYEDKFSNIGHLVGDRNTLDTTNPLLHIPVSETQLMIKDSYIKKGVTTSLDLIYGKPNIEKLMALRKKNSTTTTYPLSLTEFYDNAMNPSYEVQYQYKHHLKPTHRGMVIPITTRSKGKTSFRLEHYGIKQHWILAGIEINDRKKYEKFTTNVKYYEVMWRSIKERGNVLPRGGKKLVDSFSDLSVSGKTGSGSGRGYRQKEYDTRHSKTETVVSRHFLKGYMQLKLLVLVMINIISSLYMVATITRRIDLRPNCLTIIILKVRFMMG